MRDVRRHTHGSALDNVAHPGTTHMIIGHLPAGYVTARLLLARARAYGVAGVRFILASVIGAIAPDFDLAYFYLVDGRQHHHHIYATHYPVVWAAAMLVCVLWWCTGKCKQWALLAGVFSLGGFVHMLLDSIVGDIAWFAPFSDQRFSLFVVPALYKLWWLNFILHWSFAPEIAVTATALILWRRKPALVTHVHTAQACVKSRNFT